MWAYGPCSSHEGIIPISPVFPGKLLRYRMAPLNWEEEEKPKAKAKLTGKIQGFQKASKFFKACYISM